MFDNRHPDDVFMELLSSLGADHSRPRTIEHFLYFPTQEGAERAALELRAQGYATEVAKRREGANWLLLATGQMTPAGERISDIRRHMEHVASIFGGHYDGWGTPFTK
jgi:regulator of RNase E activity RraB